MDAPASFWALAMRFHQDVPSFVEATETALADYLIRGLDASERQELANYLDKVLRAPAGYTQLLQLWSKSRADFRFKRADDIGGFFTMIRSRL